MICVTDSVILPGAPLEVFQFVLNPQHQLKWDAATLLSLEALTPKPYGLGSRFRARFRQMGLAEYEITAFEPGKRLVHHGVNRFGSNDHLFEFVAVPEGTRLTQTSTFTTRGLGGLVAPLLRTALQRRLRHMSAAIRQYAQQPSPLATSD